MNHLPMEVHLKISSYLSLNQLADCRLVSHSFKVWAEVNMQLITHLQLRSNLSKKDVKYELRDDWDETVEEEMKESYFQHTFLSKPFVTAVVATRYPTYRAGSRFYAFLGKSCPNLQVLRMNDFTFSCEDLTLLTPELQFFICKDFTPGRSASIVAHTLDQLPNLKGFISSDDDRVSDPECINSLNRQILQLNRPGCVIGSEEALDEETVELLARGGTKCLRFRRKKSDSPSFSLSQSLAESLVELSVNFAPTSTFCSFALPNLLYLTICCDEQEWPAIDPNAFVSTPNLKCLTWAGVIAVQNLEYLINFIHSFNQLRVLHVTLIGYDDADGDDEDEDEDQDDLSQEKVKISLPTTLEKCIFKTSKHLELVNYYSTSLKYLLAQGMASFSFVCPNLKVLISWGIELDPASLSRLVNSLSHCVQLTRVSLVFDKIHESVALQPLIDMFYRMTGLTHLNLSQPFFNDNDADYDDDDCPTDSICFEPQKFPSLGNLQLDLPRTKIIFHLSDLFTRCQLTRIESSSSVELQSPNKSYSVYGGDIEVLYNEQLDKLVRANLLQRADEIELSLVQSEDTSGSQDLQCFPLHGDSETVSFSTWLLGLVNSHSNSGETEPGREKEEAALDIILPPALKQLDLHMASSPSNSLCFYSSTLEHLSISHIRQLRFHLPSLRKIQLVSWLEPLDDILVAQLDALTSMSFCYGLNKHPSVAVIESQLKTISKLKQLTTLEFSSPFNWPEDLGCVRIRQEDLPSVKRFTWTLPVSFEFYPEDKFTELIVDGDYFIEFRNKEQGYKYEFYTDSFYYTWSIELPQSGMAQLSHLDFSRAPFWYSYSGNLYLQLVERVTRVKHIEILLKEPREASHNSLDKKCQAQVNVIVEWLSSLITLTKFRGYMSQTHLNQFLRWTRTAGPLELVITKDLVLRGTCLDEGLHRTVNELMKRKVISEFSHPAKCDCRADCLIKSQPGHG